MNRRDDYISGPHHYWIHFVCGLVVGAGLGLWLGYQAFEELWGVLSVTAATALLIGYCCGRWGDRAWEKISSLLWWIV